MDHEGTRRGTPGGEDEPAYTASFEAVPSKVPIRPARSFPKPFAFTQTAVVTGPKKEKVHKDKLGRIKAHFHWDREGKKDEKSSCWIRVSQALEGLYMPGVGREVVVSFIGGDPDRPVILGMLHNGAQPPPLAKENTKSIIGAEGMNTIAFKDDKKDKEEFNTNAIRDQNETVGNILSTTIKADKVLVVEKNRKTLIKTENDVLKVEKGTREVEVLKGDEIHKNGANSTREVAGNFTLKVKGNLTIDVTGEAKIKGSKVNIN